MIWSAAAGCLLGCLVVGCVDRGHEGRERIEQLENRLVEIEQELALAKTEHASLARLRNELDELQPRIAEAAAQAERAGMIARAAAGERARKAPDYDQIQALHQDYLERRSRLERDYAPGSPQFQRALADLSRWHVERKRALSTETWERAPNKSQGGQK